MTTLSTQHDPIEALLQWPADRPLACLHSGRHHPRWASWSMLAEPVGWLVHQAGRSIWVNSRGEPAAAPWPLTLTHNPLSDLDVALKVASIEDGATEGGLGGFLGYLSYDLAQSIEPAARSMNHRPSHDRWPAFALGWCPQIHRFDSRPGRRPDSASRNSGTVKPDDAVRISELRGSNTPDEHLSRVARTIDYIAAGDIFQANITQQLSAPFQGNIRRLAACALQTSQAWYGAHLELPGGRGLISMSPELFLHVDGPKREVITRPIKGTRRALADMHDLATSAKDAAELHMIVDLMRNDLGRVCEYGSIVVRRSRDLEEHPTILHGVAEIAATLRPQTSIGELLRASFPPGSVTGAPKIRAMQIIDELEGIRRGPYCGAIGYFGLDGSITLNVAIRTIALSGEHAPGRFDVMHGTLDYGIGGGIVADSQPVEEYREAMDKAAILRRVIDASRFQN